MDSEGAEGGVDAMDVDPNVDMEVPAKKPKHKGKHDKPKPWDTDDIEHWKLEKFDPTCNEGGMLEETSFATLFPAYRGVLTGIGFYRPEKLNCSCDFDCSDFGMLRLAYKPKP